MFCLEHNKNPYTHFCFTCSKRICSTCLTTKHKDHKCLEDNERDNKKTLQDQQLIELTTQLEKYNHQLKTMKLKMKDQQLESFVSVQEKTKVLHEQLSQSTTRLKKTLNSIKNQEFRRISESRSNIEQKIQYTKQIQQYTNLAKKAKKTNRQRELVYYLSQIRKVKSFLAKIPQIEKISNDYSTCSLELPINDYEKSIDNFKVKKEYSLENTLVEITNNINIGEECFVKITLRNTSNERIKDLFYTAITVDWKNSTNNNTQLTVYQEERAGEFTTAFIPKQKGKHKIHITIDGQTLENIKDNRMFFNVNVLPPFNLEKTSIELYKCIIPNSVNYITVTIRNSEGIPIDIKTYHLVITVILKRDENKTWITMVKDTERAGVYVGTYQVFEFGKYEIEVKIDDFTLPNSPFQIWAGHHYDTFSEFVIKKADEINEIELLMGNDTNGPKIKFSNNDSVAENIVEDFEYHYIISSSAIAGDRIFLYKILLNKFHNKKSILIGIIDAETENIESAIKNGYFFDIGNGKLKHAKNILNFNQKAEKNDVIEILIDGKNGYLTFGIDKNAVAVPTIDPIFSLKGHTENLTCIACTPKNCYTASVDNTVRNWSLDNGRCESQFSPYKSQVSALAYLRGSLFTSNERGVLKSWDPSTNECIHTLKGHRGRVTVFEVDEKSRLFSGSTDSQIILWDILDGTDAQNFSGHTDYITALKSNPKDNILYSCSVDKEAYGWDISTGKQINYFKGHKDWIFDLLYDTEKQLVYTGSQDKTIKCWDPRSKECVHTLFGHESAIIKMCLYKQYLYTASWDGKIGIYNLKKLQEMPEFLMGHTSKIRCMTLFGDLLFSGGQDKTIRVWNLKNNKCRGVFKGHTAPVSKICVPTPNATISIADEPTVLRWPSIKTLRAKNEQQFQQLAKREKTRMELKRDNSYDLGSKVIEKDIEIKIDGRKYQVNSKMNLLEACRSVGFDIAALCYHPSLGAIGTCKCCVVDMKTEGSGSFKRACACATGVREGLEIKTDSPQVREQLMSAIADLRMKQKNRRLLFKASQQVNSLGTSELRQIVRSGMSGNQAKIGDTLLDDLVKRASNRFIDETNLAIKIDHTKCIDCTRCVMVCSKVQGMNVYSSIPSLQNSLMPPINTKGKFLNDTMCISCGQCSVYCPSGAITEIDHSKKVETVLKSKKKLVVVGIAPSCRISLAEIFKLTPGALTTGQCVHLLKLLGFHKIFDVQFTADLTIMEEGSELLHRLKDQNSVTPMFTSCCPGWINMVEKQYPNLIPHLSSCKSPQQMFGSVIKNYYAEKINIEPENIFCVTVMPCTAKKKELLRPQFKDKKTGLKDVDLCLTVREIGRMVKRRGIEVAELVEREFDNPLGYSTGSASLFAASGGVMEAALRSAYWLKIGEEFPELKFKPVRGLDGIKQATLDFDGKDLKLAVVSGGANIHKFLETWGTKAFDFDFIEIMACPGGCIGGGGQPRSNLDIVPIRLKAVYDREKSLPSRCSHENPLIKRLYQEWLKKPYGQVAIKHLHTTYKKYIFPSEMDPNQKKIIEKNKGLNIDNSFLILYGSQTGTAEKAAEKIATLARSKKIKVRIFEMNDYGQPINLKKEKLVIFVTSTFWDGSYPENAQKFWEKLQTLQPMSLNKLKYCAFGLGSTSYSRFNNAIKTLDAKLKELGASEILPIGLSNREDKNGYLTVLSPWMKNFEKLLKKRGIRRLWKKK
ncbi:iron hydrogenase [Anaeramoeba flamelloides]|uniref:Iron hydrogenase n=1 Tax=Anaeramoeba flamelloides TaxID=1746091 RepID=A0AAV7ZH22_9EUKA|nr:iron hydrogenase [Anaeramoeba flamelloides]